MPVKIGRPQRGLTPFSYVILLPLLVLFLFLVVSYSAQESWLNGQSGSASMAESCLADCCRRLL